MPYSTRFALVVSIRWFVLTGVLVVITGENVR